MKCLTCGQECSSSLLFCSSCGTKLERVQEQVEFEYVREQDRILEEKILEEKIQEDKKIQLEEQISIKKLRLRKVIILGIGVLLCAWILFAMVPKLFGESYIYETYSKNSQVFTAFWFQEKPFLTFFSAGGKVIITEEGDQYDMSYSMTRETIAFVAKPSHKLYVAAEGGYKLVDEDVWSVKVAEDGAVIAYMKKTGKGALYLYRYELKSEKATLISTSDSPKNYVISPDGGSVGFLKENVETKELEFNVSVQGKNLVIVGKDKIPLAISDEGAYLYYVEDNNFYVSAGSNTVLSSLRLTEEYGTIFFNKDYSQVLVREEGKSYLCEKGGERKKVSDEIILDFVLPPDAAIGENSEQIVFTLGTESLTNQIIEQPSGYYYLNDQLETNFICKEPGGKQLSTDGKSFVYLDEDDLYYIEDVTKKTIIAKDMDAIDQIMRFVATLDLSSFYYVTNKSELFCITEQEKPVKIADNVSYQNFGLNHYDGMVYFVTDALEDSLFGTLYYSKNGGARIAVQGAREVGIGGLMGGIIYSTIQGDELDYYSVIDGEATLSIENIKYK